MTVELDELRHRVRINEHEVRLTGSQMRVCLFLARARGRVHSRGQILAAAQAGRCFIRRVDERQADSLLSDVRAKFRAVHADAAGLIKAVYGEGYKAVTE